MIEFEDSEEKYDFDDVDKKKDSKVKIRVATMFVIFLMIILMLAKNNFDFNFMKISLAQVPQKCDPSYSYNSQDHNSDWVKNAERVLKDNSSEFVKIEGFSNSYVVENEMGATEKKSPPEIVLEFDRIPKSGASIPQKLCGFKVTAVFK
jgi:hypothetical protein